MDGLELWGGVECTVNRTATGYRDQIRLSGHHDRITDLDLFAGLGLSAIRYPVLWERVMADGQTPDWSWTDERLARLRSLSVRPIAGLVHHGSGPPHTHLLDDGFATGLGDYARQVAERYPWIEDWTPVNEPLTTARFSALYGHWYPHARDEGAFWLALLNQIDGTRAAMRAIRRVNPAARLIQTDDLGRTYATLVLREQAAFDNLRRWAGWDLLFGHVTPHHPLWERINGFGFGDRLRRIADAPCPPDIVGVNHYLTSDRFLDHRLQRYPPRSHGGNARRAYADVEAIRVLDPPPPGLAGALREAWDRYGVPLAVTEVHNGCTREEQLRWAAEAWDGCALLRREGVDIRAVTAWSLLGSQDWDRLLTAPGTYESGIFDISGGTPRPTALASLWKGLPAAAERHPVARAPGWWRRQDRLVYPAIPHPIRTPPSHAAPADPVLLIWSSDEALAQSWSQMCKKRGIAHQLAKCEAHGGDIAAMLDHIRPWGLVHADAPSTADAIGLARACESRGIASLHLIPAPDGHAPHETLRAAEDDIPPSFPASALLIPWEGRASIADLARMDIALDLLIDGRGGLHDPIRSAASEPPETARHAAAMGAFGDAAQI
ncbi:dTDP-4-dehydrorhamnose reductase [Sphingomonas sp. NCPPB 2930]|uniref:dTDP-4-dehydrorhamnose reductase n=1 Tax=Sphingomonas sp. NCPPB 2930 TaxID=3162788 RepID=UPI0036DE32C7